LVFHWNNYLREQEEKGKKIFASYMGLSTPVKMGNKILLEFPNKGSKDDFENTNIDLINYLKVNLKNYQIKIVISVIEHYKPKVIYTTEDKYKYFKEINPNLDLLRKKFELDI
jgi:hypothetical protein